MKKSFTPPFAVPIRLLVLAFAISTSTNSAAQNHTKDLDLSDQSAIERAIGTHVRVAGMVSQITTSKAGNVLFHFENSDLSLVILKRKKALFGQVDFEKDYQGKHVSVTGTLDLFKGQSQIQIDEPAQIQFIENSPVPKEQKQGEGEENLVKIEGVIAVTDSERILAAMGKAVTVRGIVSSTGKSKSSGMNYLNFENTDFSVVTFGKDLRNFPDGEPADTFGGKLLVVKGEMTEYKGKPQIILSSPDQIGDDSASQAGKPGLATEQGMVSDNQERVHAPQERDDVDASLYFGK